MNNILLRSYRNLTSKIVVTALTLMAATSGYAQPAGFNYDESKVPEYTLPALLTDSAGQPVADAEAWMSKRRPEVLALFQQHVFGHITETIPKIRTRLR